MFKNNIDNSNYSLSLMYCTGMYDIICFCYFWHLRKQIKVTPKNQHSMDVNIVMGYVIGNTDISHNWNSLLLFVCL